MSNILKRSSLFNTERNESDKSERDYISTLKL